MKYFLVFLLFLFSNQFVNAQEIDYEQFKGEKINLRFAVKFLNASITTYSGQGSPYRTIENIDSINTTGRLLSKFYFEPNNPSLYIENKRTVKNKSTKNYDYEDLENNHFEFEYSFNFQHLDSTHYSIIRYKEIQDGKKKAAKVITAQNNNGNWLIVKNPLLYDIAYVIEKLPSDVFRDDLHTSREKGLADYKGDKEYMDLIKSLRSETKTLFYGSGFDVKKLANALKSVEKDNPKLFAKLNKSEE